MIFSVTFSSFDRELRTNRVDISSLYTRMRQNVYLPVDLLFRF